jgi:hypothetical protein
VPDLGRQPDLRFLPSDELHRTRRDLAVSMALTRPGSPVAIPITAHLQAIDAELARRSSTPTPDR